jgi:DNA-binding GntR family transcriptional regulator
MVIFGTRERFTNLLEIREALDGAVARLAAQRMSDEALDELRHIVKRHEAAILAHDVERHFVLDLEFHAHLCRHCGNTLLADALFNLRDQIRVVMRTVFAHADPLLMSPIAQHMEILTEIERKDADRAETMARKHVRAIGDALLPILDERKRDMAKRRKPKNVPEAYKGPPSRAARHRLRQPGTAPENRGVRRLQID